MNPDTTGSHASDGNGVGSRFRGERLPIGSSLAENDSRPGVFNLFGFRLISCFCVDRLLFRFGGRFLRPQRACLAGERDCMARISASNPDPRVLVTWVKKICRLRSQAI
jgi:hypothetical protein